MIRRYEGTRAGISVMNTHQPDSLSPNPGRPPSCRRALPILLSLAVIATPICSAAAATAPANPDTSQDATGIFERIRQDVGYYALQAAQWRGVIAPKIPDPAMPPAPFKIACPKSLANYDFDITKVEVSLQVVAGNTATADGGLKIPITPATLDLNDSRAQTQTRTIILDRIPSNDPAELVQFRNGPDYANLTTGHQAFLAANPPATATHPPVLPISNTIIGLRNSLVASAGKVPCFDIAQDKSVSDTIKFDFEVDKSADPTIGFTLLIVTAKADDKIQNKIENTITITIAPHPKPAATRQPNRLLSNRQ
jgi:hypothetical protein